MIIVGCIQHHYVRSGIKDQKYPYTNIICNHANAAAVFENYVKNKSYKYRENEVFITVKPKGYSDYVLIDLYACPILGLIPDIIIYSASHWRNEELPKYDQVKIAITNTSCFETYYKLDKHYENTTSQIVEQPQSSRLINETLVAEVNKLRVENDELKSENENLKTRLQQIINLAK